jgi:hypothetical protein
MSLFIHIVFTMSDVTKHHIKTKAIVEFIHSPQDEAVFLISVSRMLEALLSHTSARHSLVPPVSDSDECSPFESMEERTQVCRKVDYLCSLADAHLQSSNTKFLAIETFLRLHFRLKQESMEVQFTYSTNCSSKRIKI